MNERSTFRSLVQVLLEPSRLGTFYCILSAGFYTLMGACQRELSENCDPVWVNCVQASVSTVVFGIYLTSMSVRGKPAWPTFAVAGSLMMLGIVTQLGGASYQWSLGVIGLAIGNPMQMGVMLVSAAILGWFILRERISWRAMTAILLITVSIMFLSTGAEEAHEAMREAGSTAAQPIVVEGGSGTDPQTAEFSGFFWTMAGIGATCFSGLAFAILTVGMRKTATEETSPEAIVFFINCMGILFLGPWALARLGLGGIMATSARDLGIMLMIGMCNLLAFFLIAKALQLTSVVRVNVINNAVTTALTVLVGIMVFAEPANSSLIVGIVLTCIGIVLIGTSEADAGKVETPVMATSPEPVAADEGG